jgi:hypothetical protein
MTPKVTKVNPLPDYKLDLTFNNGQKKRFDMRPYLKYQVYKDLADISNFMKTHICNGTVCWGDSELVDIDPDIIFYDSEPIN